MYFTEASTSQNDYYPFGMLLPNRHESSNEYRYGFNGQEKDDEIAGEGNSYTAEYWQYDSRLGRRWNVDPVVKTHESPYATFANNPIWFTDPNGADSVKVFSGSVSESGGKIGTGDGEKALLLFTAYSDVKTGLNGTDANVSLSYSEFNSSYQMVAENLSSNYGELKYASFVNANDKSSYFNLAVKTVSLGDLQGVVDKGIKKISDSWQPNWMLKLSSFGHGKEFDIKSNGKLLDGFPLVYVEGIGMYNADFLGNLTFGAQWSGFQDLSESWSDGDIIQKKSGSLPRNGIDDPYDSYAIMLGHMSSSKLSEQWSFNTKMYFNKHTRLHMNGLNFISYKTKYKNGETYKNSEIYVTGL